MEQVGQNSLVAGMGVGAGEGVGTGEGVVGEKAKQEKPPARDYFFKDQEASQSGASNSGNNCID